MKFYISSNGVKVNLTNSALEHLQAHKDVLNLLGEVVSKSKIKGNFSIQAIELGRVVGKSGALYTDKVALDEKVFWLMHCVNFLRNFLF